MTPPPTQRARPSSAPASPTKQPINHLRAATTATTTARLVPARSAWTTGTKRPAATWAARNANHYQKYSAAEPVWQQPPTLLRVPSWGATDGDAYVAGAAADADGEARRRRSSGSGAAALRRLSLASQKERHEKVKPATPGLVALLQSLQEPSVEELTEGGTPVSSMEAALAALPRSHKLAAEERSTAIAMEQALEAAVNARDPVVVRKRRPGVATRLNRLEEAYQRELQPTNQVQGLTHLLQKHRNMLQAKFAAWDIDGNGELTRFELVAVMESLGLEARDDEIDDFFAEFDPDGSGALDLKEFYGVAFSGGLGNLGRVG